MPKEAANTQDLVAIEEIREGTVILKDGSLRQVVIVGGVNFSLKSEAEQNVITQAFQNFLNGVNFPLQTIVHSRKINIERYLASLEERRAQESSPILQDQIAEYQQFIRGFVSENAIMAKTFLVVVPYASLALPGKQTLLGFLPFGKKTKASEEEAVREHRETFEKNLGQLKQRVTQVVDGLTAAGLDAVALNDEQLIELFYNFYNPEAIEKERTKLPSP